LSDGTAFANAGVAPGPQVTNASDLESFRQLLLDQMEPGDDYLVHAPDGTRERLFAYTLEEQGPAIRSVESLVTEVGPVAYGLFSDAIHPDYSLADVIQKITKLNSYYGYEGPVAKHVTNVSTLTS
jgi:hypothetical protein